MPAPCAEPLALAQAACPGWADSAVPGWLCDARSGRVLAANAAAQRQFGESAARALPGGAPATPWPAPGEGAPLRTHQLADGTPVEVELHGCPAAPEGRAQHVVFARDVTARERERRAAQALARRLRLAETVFERSHDAVAITDAANRIVAVNQAFTRITGYAAAEVLGRNPRLLASGRQDPAFYQEMWRAIGAHGAWEGEIWNRRAGGECYPEWLRISVVRDAAGAVTHHVAMFSDISKAKADEARIHQLAFFDALTGLPNRVLARERLAEAIGQADRDGRRVGVMFLDLDRFKGINDSLGHAVGDELLRAVSQRLRALMRPTDTVARLGGDEFLLVLPGIGEPAELEPIAQRLVQRVAEPVAHAGCALHVGASIGITVYPDDARDADALLRNADTAMYEAKRGRGRGYHVFAPELHASAAARWRLESDLRAALAAGELRLHYQPQVALASGTVAGREALVRWQHPQRGLLAPAAFIELAEDSGLIVPLGAWVLAQACRDARAWQAPGGAPVAVAVNVSAQQFRSPGFYDTVAAALAEAGLAPACLELELTERTVMDDTPAAIALLERLRALGVRLAIDDFGTGFSSLAALRRLPLDALKIDRAFIAGLEAHAEDRAITRTVITLARSLGLAVVAEGVETAAQRDWLAQQGCDLAQGFYFGRPQPLGT